MKTFSITDVGQLRARIPEKLVQKVLHVRMKCCWHVQMKMMREEEWVLRL